MIIGFAVFDGSASGDCEEASRFIVKLNGKHAVNEKTAINSKVINEKIFFIKATIP